MCRTRARWGSCERRTGEAGGRGKVEEENRVTAGRDIFSSEVRVVRDEVGWH